MYWILLELRILLLTQLFNQWSRRSTAPIDSLQCVDKKLEQLRHHMLITYYQINVALVFYVKRQAVPGIERDSAQLFDGELVHVFAHDPKSRGEGLDVLNLAARA
jgi:hypothetical protein